MTSPALSRQQVDRLRRLLQAQQQEMHTLLHHGSDAAKPVTLDQQSVGRVSRIDAIQQQQMALANREQSQRLMTRVEQALARIKNDEFGICLDCGEPIPYARLEAQPCADLCIECQSKSEA